MKYFVITTKQTNRDIKHIKEKFSDINVVYAVKDEIPYISLYKTVLKILEENNNQSDVIIFEDDVKFTKEFSMKKIENIVNKYRETYQVFTTGFITREPVKPNDFILKIENNGFEVKEFFGTQGVVYTKGCISNLNKNNFHIDRAICETLKTFAIFPFMTTQHSYNDSQISGIYDVEDRFKRTELIINKYLKQ